MPFKDCGKLFNATLCTCLYGLSGCGHFKLLGKAKYKRIRT
uniref:Lipoprotein n=1 Tax=Lepeophtheirus salmonis TaxID=72036 RepID=A0A0K2U398_LEPSM